MTANTSTAADLHARIVAAAGFGRFSGLQLARLGLTGADLAALISAGFARFDRVVEGSQRADGRCDCWYIIFA